MNIFNAENFYSTLTADNNCMNRLVFTTKRCLLSFYWMINWPFKRTAVSDALIKRPSIWGQTHSLAAWCSGQSFWKCSTEPQTRQQPPANKQIFILSGLKRKKTTTKKKAGTFFTEKPDIQHLYMYNVIPSFFELKRDSSAFTMYSLLGKQIILGRTCGCVGGCGGKASEEQRELLQVTENGPAQQQELVVSSSAKGAARQVSYVRRAADTYVFLGKKKVFILWLVRKNSCCRFYAELSVTYFPAGGQRERFDHLSSWHNI